MQKRSNLLLLSVLLLSISCLTAQNTGYMGKRVIFNMGVELSPAWLRPNFSDNLNFQYKWYSFNYTLSPNIEIIAHKTGTAGIAYHFLKTKFDTPYNEDFISPKLDAFHNLMPPDLTSHGFGIFYKQYIFSGRAPIGAYIRFQFDGFFFKCPPYYDEYGHFSEISDQLFATKVELGNDFLLFNRLRLSTGLSSGITFGGYKDDGFFSGFLGYDEFYQPANEYARSRILGLYWFAFTVNIGFLAF